jgi:hypothetical protein
MKTILLVCALGALGACDDTSATMAAQDLSAPADLATAPDLLTAGSCSATVACIQLCTPANLNTCVPACLAGLNATAKPYFTALQTCSGPACTFNDAGFGPCETPASAACNTCVMQNCGSEATTCQAH